MILVSHPDYAVSIFLRAIVVERLIPIANVSSKMLTDLQISPIILFSYLLFGDNLIKSFTDIALYPKRAFFVFLRSAQPFYIPTLYLNFSCFNVNKLFIMVTMFFFFSRKLVFP